MLSNEIPFRASGRVAAEHHAQPISIAHLFLQLLLKTAHTAAITASSVSQDQELVYLRIGQSSLFFPTAGNGCHGKLGVSAERPI